MRKRGFFPTLCIIVVFAVLGLGAYTFLKDMDGPTLTVKPDTGRLSPSRNIVLTLEDPSGIRSVSVAVRKNNSSIVVFQKHFSEVLPQQSVTFSLKEAGIREGAFDLEIKATDASLAGFGQGNTRTQILPMRMDIQPPRIAVKSFPPNVRRGGTGVVQYTLNEEVLYSGIKVGGLFFKGYQQPDGSYLCFFAFPHTLSPAQYSPEITAEDLAGNITASRLAMRALDRPFRADKIQISDDFLQKVSQQLYNLAPNAANPLERYIAINRDVRAGNVKFLLETGNKSHNTILWSGAFARLPRSAARAGFADHRSYVYQGQEIDNQYHLGFDLASLSHAEIPAGNNGVVVFTGDMGIYGNMVLIDHGMGLMSLYSHMSRFTVAAGDTVKKGDTIGHTGSTGMAFGDHLHFGILVGGVEVTPLEWLDPKWIKDNITSRINNPN
ncbi:MAG: M23 family metallopeptidase [Desulfovibrionaceae bacterium]